MGERLNVEIVCKKRILANSYYHWSAYSLCALETINPIIEYLNNNDVKPTVRTAVNLLKLTGADYPGKDRNMGLIGVTKKEIEETQLWQDGKITIDLYKKRINYECYYKYNKEDREDNEYKKSAVKIKKINNLKKIPFNKIYILYKGIKQAESTKYYAFKVGNKYYQSVC